MVTTGGTVVEVVEVDAERVLVRQVGGCVQPHAGGWVDRARLYWLEHYELRDLEEGQLPARAWYGCRVPR